MEEESNTICKECNESFKQDEFTYEDKKYVIC